MDKFADETDRAAAIAEAANESAVEEARWAARPEQVRNPDGSWPTTECVDCGEEIEEGRLALGYVRCFRCKNLIERRGRQYAR